MGVIIGLDTSNDHFKREGPYERGSARGRQVRTTECSYFTIEGRIFFLK